MDASHDRMRYRLPTAGRRIAAAAAKHARASRVTVCAHARDANLHLSIRDNGIGGVNRLTGPGSPACTTGSRRTAARWTSVVTPGAGLPSSSQFRTIPRWGEGVRERLAAGCRVVSRRGPALHANVDGLSADPRFCLRLRYMAVRRCHEVARTAGNALATTRVQNSRHADHGSIPI
jgi:hypothetical protein